MSYDPNGLGFMELAVIEMYAETHFRNTAKRVAYWMLQNKPERALYVARLAIDAVWPPATFLGVR